MITEIFDVIQGAHQLHKGNKLARDTQRPWMEIPDAAIKSLRVAKSSAAQTQLPGQDLIEQKLDERFANYADALGRTSIGSAGDINNLNQMYGENTDQLKDVGIAAAEYRQRNQENLQNELNNMADWQQQKFMYNFDEPYRIKSATASALKGAGLQNLHTGISGLEKDATQIAMMMMGMPTMPGGGGEKVGVQSGQPTDSSAPTTTAPGSDQGTVYSAPQTPGIDQNQWMNFMYGG